jgi:hypothetical protein
MTLEAVGWDLQRKWQRLNDQLVQDLLWAVTETRPADEGHALATRYEDGVTDLLDQARTALLESQRLTDGPPSLAGASRALVVCQRCFNRLAGRLASDFLSYQRVGRLRRFGRERGGGWRDWAEHVGRALERCREPLEDLNQTLLEGWQEITERVGMTAPSVAAADPGRPAAVAANGPAAAADVP